jgi:antitoxin ParD1/3/4
MSDRLKSVAEEQVSQRGCGTRSEPDRELVRDDRDRLRLRGLLLVGAETAPTAPANGAYFEDLRQRVRKSTKTAVRG